jgi:diaminopimelate decarboxylase
MGGGFGIPYENETHFPMSELAEEAKKLSKSIDCRLHCEPGRYLVAQAGVLLTEVQYVKTTPHKTFIITNTGMHHFLRPALYSAHHQILSFKEPKGNTAKYDVVGPICESSDWISKDCPLPPTEQNDILAICDAGAYGFVMASNYNQHPFPREVLI